MLNRRAFLKAAAAAAMSGAMVQAQTVPRRPNIILVVADDLGYGDLGCYGHRVLQTPNIDAIAADGVRFPQFYASSPVCSPTRAAILTGRIPAEIRVHHAYLGWQLNASRGMGQYLDPRLPNLARLLGAAGYATGHFGKWHLGNGNLAPPSAYGFQAAKLYDGKANPLMQGPYARARSASAIVDDVLGFAAANGSQPFFANAWMMLPHAPLQPTPEQLARYAHLGSLDRPSPEQIYFASVSAIDDAVGRLVRGLRRMRLLDDTLLVFTSDNGPETAALPAAASSAAGSTGGLRGRKRSLYEGGIRVPLIARWANGGVRDGREQPAVSATIDLLPTLASLAGVQVPPRYKVDGLNLAPLWRRTQHRPWTRPEPLFWDFRFEQLGIASDRSPRLAVRQGDWKLLCDPTRAGAELYNLEDDADESRDVCRWQQPRVAEMSQRLMTWHLSLPSLPNVTASPAVQDADDR